MLTARQQELIERGLHAEYLALALEECGDLELAVMAADMALAETTPPPEEEPPIPAETIAMPGEDGGTGSGAATGPGDFAPEPRPPVIRDKAKRGSRGGKRGKGRKLSRGLRLKAKWKKIAKEMDAAFGSAVLDTPVKIEEDSFAVDDNPSSSHVGLIADGVQLPEAICVPTGYGRLRSVLVGIPDNDVLPRWYPMFDNSEGNEVGGPETAGLTKAQFSPPHFAGCVRQLDAFCELLEAEGVQVFRAPLTPLSLAQAEPVGLGATWAREEFTVIGNNLIVNQPRAPHRHKELTALATFFVALKQHFPSLAIHRPPAPLDWDKNTDWENDPRCFIEGGDIFHLDETNVLVTLSYLATSGAGFRWLADILEPQGYRVWPAYTKRDENDWEHGDYCFLPIRPGLAIAYLPAFVDGLPPSPCLDWTIVPVTLDEANDQFQTNGMILRENVVCLPSGSRRLVRALEKKGVDVIEVECADLLYWQGGLRCATSALWRE